MLDRWKIHVWMPVLGEDREGESEKGHDEIYFACIDAPIHQFSIDDGSPNRNEYSAKKGPIRLTCPSVRSVCDAPSRKLYPVESTRRSSAHLLSGNAELNHTTRFLFPLDFHSMHSNNAAPRIYIHTHTPSIWRVALNMSCSAQGMVRYTYVGIYIAWVINNLGIFRNYSFFSFSIFILKRFQRFSADKRDKW